MKILFLTPSASRGGSEMMLLHLIHSMDQNEFECALYADSKGALVEEFSKKIPTYYSGGNYTTKYRVKNKIHKTLFKKSLNESLLLKIHQKFNPDFWYFNTIALTNYADMVAELKIPYVIHFHEMISVYDQALGSRFAKLISNADMLIGCSNAVCEQLAAFNHPRIEKFNEIVDLRSISVREEQRKKIRKQLGIRDDEFVWLMSGAMSIRKGFDMIPNIMQHLDQNNTHIVWLGRDRDTGYVYATKQLVKNKFPSNIHFIGERSNDYYDYLNICDGFLLTSREDPFPLVMIEAAYLQKPIAAFSSGGVTEFLKAGMGAVSKQYDAGEIAVVMKKIMNNEIPIDRNLLRSRAMEFDASQQVAKWEAMMKHYHTGKVPHEI